MMNFDDPFTRDFEEKFKTNLHAIRAMKPSNFQEIKENISAVSELLNYLNNNPEKSEENLELLSELNAVMKEMLQKFEDMKLILDESLYRKSRAYFEHVKKLAKEGDKEAEKIYNDLKIHFENQNLNN